MTASAGRQITVHFGGNSPTDLLAGVREKGVELNGEPIDITSDDDDGWRTLLTIPAQNEINISLSGVSKDNILKTHWFNGSRSQPSTITFEDGSTITGTFFLASFSETGTYNEATVYEAELQSSGIVTFTAAP